MANSNPSWGPRMWAVFHMRALMYSPSQANAFRNWIYSLPNKIPCGACANHFVELINADPVDNALDSTENLVAWSVIIHNMVNTKLGKPEYPVESVWNNQLGFIASGLLASLSF